MLSQQCGGVKRTQIMVQLERFNVTYAITSLVAEIEKEDQIEQLEEGNRLLLGRHRCLVVVHAQQSKEHGSLADLLRICKPSLAHECENSILRVISQAIT